MPDLVGMGYCSNTQRFPDSEKFLRRAGKLPRYLSLHRNARQRGSCNRAKRQRPDAPVKRQKQKPSNPTEDHHVDLVGEQGTFKREQIFQQ